VRDRPNPVSFNLDGYGTLQQCYRRDQATAFRHLNDNSFNAAKRPLLDQDRIPDAKKGPGLGWQPGTHNGLNGRNFGVIHWHRSPPHADNVNHTGNLQHRHSIPQVEPAEDVPRKQRRLDSPYPIGPASPNRVHGQKSLIPQFAEHARGRLLAACPDTERKPGLTGFGRLVARDGENGPAAHHV
jgi:hypothetical protein